MNAFQSPPTAASHCLHVIRVWSSRALHAVAWRSICTQPCSLFLTKPSAHPSRWTRAWWRAFSRTAATAARSSPARGRRAACSPRRRLQVRQLTVRCSVHALWISILAKRGSSPASLMQTTGVQQPVRHRIGIAQRAKSWSTSTLHPHESERACLKRRRTGFVDPQLRQCSEEAVQHDDQASRRLLRSGQPVSLPQPAAAICRASLLRTLQSWRVSCRVTLDPGLWCLGMRAQVGA
jgi:hypothetical protein